MRTTDVSYVSSYDTGLESEYYRQAVAEFLLSLHDDSPGCYTVQYDGIRENQRIDLRGSTVSADDQRRVYQQMRRYGYAIVQLGIGLTPEDIVQSCSDLGLHQVFVPDYLKQSPAMVTSCGMNFIPPFPHPDLPPTSKHKAFLGKTDHALHVDGANCPGLGMVRTAILYCVSKAALGGENTVFNAIGAFVALAQQDNELVLPLLHPQALTRNGSSELTEVVGPAFELVGDELHTRYSVDYASTWNFDRVYGLEKAFKRLEELAKPGSAYYSETMLEDGELLILANDQIAHGRKGFNNSASVERRMGRVLFLDSISAVVSR